MRTTRPRRRRRVPFVAQREAADCGAACLTMVVQLWGSRLTLEDVRGRLGVGRDGVDAATLLEVGGGLGLNGRALRIEPAALRELPFGSILHWDLDHFVVLERCDKRSAVIVDPAFGRRRVSLEHVSRSLSGIALVFEPGHELATAERRPRKASRYRIAIRDHRAPLIRAIILSVWLRLLGLLIPILTILVIDRVVGLSDLGLLGVVAGGVGALALANFLTMLVRGQALLELRARLEHRLTTEFVAHLLRLPFSFFHLRSTGDLMMRVGGNSNIREAVTSSVLSSVLDGTLVLLYLGLALVIEPRLAAVALGVGVAQIGVFALARRRVQELSTQGLEAQARSQSYLVQAITGMESLKVAAAEQRATQHWSRLYVDELNVAVMRGRLTALVDAARSTLSTVAPLLLLGYGATLVVAGDLTLGSMLAVNTLALGFLGPLEGLVTTAFAVTAIASQEARVDDVMSTKTEDVGTGSSVGKLDGRLQLCDVSFRYNPRGPLVLDSVNLDVAPGSSVAIVGRSGSGKSTLSRLLLGLYHPTAGSVRIDGYGLDELDLYEVRRQFGVVPQSPHILAGSIRQNIALADPSLTLDEVKAAARRAQIHEDIASLPMGYDTVLPDAGASLSGGQRQRLALARALVHSPSVLLLDEATSALDGDTENAVLNSLAEAGCTRIVIAHRLSTIASADEIIVLERGRIVERGKYDQLLAQKGPFARLAEAQSTRN